MALRHIDGFDHYLLAESPRKYETTSTPTITAGAGRRGGNAANLDFVRTFDRRLDAQQTWIVGFAFKFGTLPVSTVILYQFLEDATEHLSMRMDSTGHLIISRAGTTLGTTVVTMATATYYYIEIKVKIDNTTGTYEIRRDGVNILSGTGADTQNGGTATANRHKLGNQTVSTGTTVGDDYYICDGTGSAPQNDFLGDCRVDTLYPNGAGNSTQFTPSTGSNFQCLDEALVSDTDYVEDATVGHKDTYDFTTISHNPVTIYGVQSVMSVEKDDAGAKKTLAAVVRSAGTDYDGSTSDGLGTSYRMHLQLWSQDPATAAAWTQANIGAAQWGFKVIA